MTDSDLKVPPTKYCSKCQQHKPRAEFYKNGRARDRLQCYCKKCMNAVSKLNEKKRRTSKIFKKERDKQFRAVELAKLLKFSEEDVRLALEEIEGNSRSTSHSVLLARELIKRGVGPTFVAGILKRVMLEGDPPAVMNALKTVIDVCGYQYVAKKDDTEVPPMLVQIFRGMQQLPVEQKIARHEELKNRIGKSRIGEILGGATDGEVDEGGNGIHPPESGT